MSFFGKLKAATANDHTKAAPTHTKKDPNAPQPTPLEKHLADVTGPVRPDGSDKYFGFENYGSTCYCNSIIQCLYYSAPFREHVINFPSKAFLDQIRPHEPNGVPNSPRITATTPYPNPTSPARKLTVPGSPVQVGARPEDPSSPEERKKRLLAQGPVLDMQYDSSQSYGMDESLFTSLRDIFEAIIKNQSRTGVVSPHRFLEILRRDNEMFRSAMHQDAHEFLNLLLNSVVDNVEMFAKQYPGLTAAPHANGGVKGMAMAKSVESNAAASTLDTHWVHDLFEGLLTSETRCLTCENTSQRDEAFLDLSVDLSPHTSVTSCLRKFSEEEMLCERNKFHCDNCGGLQEAEKRMKIKRLPQILALHLKRFKYTEDLQRLQKLFHRVVYPFYLRLFNTTDDAEDSDRLYELYSVVVHIGGGPYHGHYVSIVKTEDRGWLLFDDELVEPVSKDYVQQFFGGEPVPGAQDAKQLACAYVLFYQETTMEKMLKEQEMEGQPTTQVPTRVSETDTAREHATSPIRTNGLHHVTTNVQTPMPEEYTHHMDPLAHAQTAPNTIHTMMYDGPPPTPVLPTKSKKELKQEEKERKAAEKVAQKEREARYRDAAMRRMETLKKAEEDMKVVLEQSKQTAAAEALARAHEEEAKRNAHHPHPQQLQEERKTHSSSPFARLSRRSISLRKKPSIFDKKSRTESTSNGNALPPLPQGASASTANHSQYPNRNQTRTPVSNPHSHQRHESSPAASGVGNGSTTPTGRRRDEFERGPFAPPLDEAEGNNGDGGDAVGNHQQEQPQSQHGHAHHHSYHDFVPSVPRRVLTTHHHGSGPGQEKGKKNRFSLGRKKSALI